MALVRGIHIIAGGDPEKASWIAEDIRQNERLLVGPGRVFGVGANGPRARGRFGRGRYATGDALV
jgi:hypothetical protein